jgi:hypothetical protein
MPNPAASAVSSPELRSTIVHEARTQRTQRIHREHREHRDPARVLPEYLLVTAMPLNDLHARLWAADLEMPEQVRESARGVLDLSRHFD